MRIFQKNFGLTVENRVFLLCAAFFCAFSAKAEDCKLYPLWENVPAPEVARQKEIRHLLYQDCGSCHGLQLKGGLGLPLKAENLKERDPESMLLTILQGRPGTAMPPFAPFLNENEARWLLMRLYANCSPRIENDE